MILINMFRGFFMALADSVPGVSGGTIAFIMGFYDDFINSLNTLISKSKNIIEKKAALLFLGKLGIGWIVGLTLSVFILASIFESEIYKISSVFVGLILFSIPLIIKEETASLKKNYYNVVFTIVGAILVYWLTVLNGQVIHTSEMDTNAFTFTFGLYVFLAGMFAISAMILPGISGSSFLLIFGVYSTIIIAIKETVTFNFHYLPILIFFGIGIITGVLSVIRLVKYLLNDYRSQMIYLILGLMIGSLYAVFMGPTTLDIPQNSMNMNTFNIFFFLLGGIIIFGLDEIKRCLK